MAADQERAERIRALKQERPDLTWRRIADHVGVTERSATDWQRKGGIEYDNAKKLAALFEVDVDYIWRGTETDTPSPFAGQDGLADRLDAIDRALAEAREERDEHTRQISSLIETQNQNLKRQSEVLERIEQSIQREEQAKTETEEATRLLLETVDVANRALLDGAQRSAEAPEPRAR